MTVHGRFAKIKETYMCLPQWQVLAYWSQCATLPLRPWTWLSSLREVGRASQMALNLVSTLTQQSATSATPVPCCMLPRIPIKFTPSSKTSHTDSKSYKCNIMQQQGEREMNCEIYVINVWEQRGEAGIIMKEYGFYVSLISFINYLNISLFK